MNLPCLLSFNDSQFMAKFISYITSLLPHPNYFDENIRIISFNLEMFQYISLKYMQSLKNIFMIIGIYLNSSNNSLMIFIFRATIVLKF